LETFLKPSSARQNDDVVSETAAMEEWIPRGLTAHAVIVASPPSFNATEPWN
jgi:hypothetical protein